MTDLKPWLEVAEPRRDIADGSFDESLFAADLGLVDRDRGPVDYLDPVTFCEKTYLTENLFGEKPNPRLLSTTNAYEVTSQFLQRLYHPLVEAASRDIALPDGAMLHVFTDISLTGKSAVLVVYVSGNNHQHQLLMLDTAKAWELVMLRNQR